MIDKDKFDAYLELADYWTNSYQQRSEIEWKVGLGLWAVILTGIVSSHTLCRPPHFTLWLFFVWLVYIVVWLIPTLLKNRQDKHLAHLYAAAGTALVAGEKANAAPESRVEDLRDLVAPAVITTGELKRRMDWLNPYSVVFHALTTGVLLLALNHSLKQ